MTILEMHCSKNCWRAALRSLPWQTLKHLGTFTKGKDSLKGATYLMFHCNKTWVDSPFASAVLPECPLRSSPPEMAGFSLYCLLKLLEGHWPKLLWDQTLVLNSNYLNQVQMWLRLLRYILCLILFDPKTCALKRQTLLPLIQHTR